MPPSPKLLFGPMLLGCFLNLFLYGVLTVQTLIYFQAYKKDRLWIRLLVVYLFLAETANSGCAIYMMYQPLVEQYGTPAATTFFPKTLAADPIVTVLISTPVQMFIAYRQVISKSMIVPIIVVLLALTSTGGAFWLGYCVIDFKRFARKPELHNPALIWLSTSAAADILITVGLTWSLYSRKTGFSDTDSKVNKIIRLTVQTGLITTIFAALDIICFLVLPGITLNFLWDFALSKLYSNSLLSTLNARTDWAGMATGRPQTNVLFGTSNPTASVTATGSRAAPFNPTSPITSKGRGVEVQVTKQVYELD
ncbi:hypothetical protein DL96DRAFT_1707019 [Flagelloscypha sp. PMI_526]|nr:hypothetical protein DL96DRAFT_1707019 [Flagelloscypha sp. PMI_526]